MKSCLMACAILILTGCAVQEDYAEQYDIPGMGISASSDKSGYTAVADNGPLRHLRLFSEYDMKNGEIVEAWFVHNNHSTRAIRVKIAYYKGSFNDNRKYYRTYVLAPGEVKSLRDKRSGRESRLLARLEEAHFLR